MCCYTCFRWLSQLLQSQTLGNLGFYEAFTLKLPFFFYVDIVRLLVKVSAKPGLPD